MSTHASGAQRAHDNAAMAARAKTTPGAVRNPWQRGARSTTPQVGGAPPPKPPKPPRASSRSTAHTASQGRKGQHKPTANQPTNQAAAKQRVQRAYPATLNTVMRFTPESVHPAFMHDDTLAALERTWKREMEGGRLPVADGLGHKMEVSQARLLMSQAKYLTDAMPWLRESLERVAPSELPDVQQFLKAQHVTGTRGTRANPVIAITASYEHPPADDAGGGRKWVVMGPQANTYKGWRREAAPSGRGHRAGSHTDLAGRRSEPTDGAPYLVNARTAASTLTHEFGHVAMSAIARNPEARAALATYRRNFARYWRDSPTRPASRLSQYAKASPGEGFAEAFTALIHGTPRQRSQPIVQEVARIINVAHPNTFLMAAPVSSASSAKRVRSASQATTRTTTRTTTRKAKP